MAVSGARVPERLRWAVEVLDPRPGEHVLEIGGGPGVAAGMICDRIGGGHLLGVDRSATAVAAARERNAGDVAAGRAEFRQVALEDLTPASVGERDAVLAVNVNLFWTRSPTAELALFAEVLGPDGRLCLVYDPPSRQRAGRLAELLADHLGDALFDAGFQTREDGPRLMVAVVARPARPAPVQ